jgi:glycosyltransferase involved in cell wall biosynthesis
MKNILQVCDSFGWAINNLAQDFVTHNPQFNWKRLAIHPKDLELKKVDLTEFREALKWADVIDAHYWRTLAQLAEQVPEMKSKKIILHHHNEKNLLSENWDYVSLHIAHTSKSKEVLEEVYPGKVSPVIHNHYDESFFEYTQEYNHEAKTIGYVGRIVPWKGLKEIARAAYELGAKVKFMGKPDKASYLAEIPMEHQENIDFEFMACDDNDKPEFYRSLTVYVGNSGEGRETGPLGAIEAMASGIPVVSTRAGIMQDLGKHQENYLSVPYDDYTALKEAISQVLKNKELAEKLREAGWNTVRQLNGANQAWKMGKLYYEVLYGEKKDLVSVIVPATLDRIEDVKKIAQALEIQSYRELELVVVWDELEQDTKVLDINIVSIPVRHLWTERQGYNLGYARDLGVSYAHGTWILFCDSRLKPDYTAVQEFIYTASGSREKVWYFGDKGSGKRNFVENFSFIRRGNFIGSGMSNQLITGYGGMSQELRERFASQGYSLFFVPSAFAEEIKKSGSKSMERRRSLVAMKNVLARLNL